MDLNFNFGPSFFFSLIFGLIGTGYFMYGKREGKFTPLLIGIVLGVYPYFIKSAAAVVLVGLALMAVPVFIKD